jgi:hypothetical protein
MEAVGVAATVVAIAADMKILGMYLYKYIKQSK